jgi:hypothetical protein
MNLEERAPLTPKEFAHLGVDDMAYVKAITVNDEPAFAVHAADGTPMGVMQNRETAFAALRQHDLEPMSVH